MKQHVLFKPFIISLVVLMSTAPIAFAQNPWANNGGNEPGGPNAGQSFQQRGQGQRGGFLSQLNLTSAQKQKLKTLMLSHRQKNRELRQQLMEERQRFRQMVHKGTGTREEALALEQEIAQHQQAMMEQHINMLYDIKSVLSPEQFEKFRTAMQQRQRRRGQGGFQQRTNGFQGRGYSGGPPE